MRALRLPKKAPQDGKGLDDESPAWGSLQTFHFRHVTPRKFRIGLGETDASPTKLQHAITMEHVAYKQLKDDIEQATQKGDWFKTMGLLMMQPVYGVYHDLTTKPFPRSLMSPATMKLASSGLVGTYMTTVVDQLVFAAGGSVDGAEERAEKFEDTLRKDLLKLVIVLSFAFSFMLGLAVAAGAKMNYDAYTEQREKAQADADKAASATKAAKQNDAPAPNLRDIDFDAIEKGQSALEELRAKAARESVLRQCPEAALAAEEAAAAASKARKAAEEAAAAAREVGKNAKEAKEAAGNEVRKASKKAAAEAAARLVEQKKGEADHYDSLAKEAKERVRDEMESYAEKARTVTKNQFSEVEKMLAEAKEIKDAVDDEVHEAGETRAPQKLKSLQKDTKEAIKRIENIWSGARGLNMQADYMWKTLDATNVSAEKEFDFTKMNDLLKVRDSAKQMCKEAGIELRKMENATRDEVAAYELRKLERTALSTSVEAGRAADHADEAAKDAANYARASANART